jgi:hypothetical protein
MPALIGKNSIAEVRAHRNKGVKVALLLGAFYMCSARKNCSLKRFLRILEKKKSDQHYCLTCFDICKIKTRFGSAR